MYQTLPALIDPQHIQNISFPGAFDDWNRLPTKVTDCHTLEDFKTAVIHAAFCPTKPTSPICVNSCQLYLEEDQWNKNSGLPMLCCQAKVTSSYNGASQGVQALVLNKLELKDDQ